MLNQSQFDVLVAILKSEEILTQRELSEKVNISLGKVNSIISDLKEIKAIDENQNVTEKGLEILKPYKVQNAVIMAAGMSSRFAPLSYEKPKGLLKVKGEKLIERQIRQLHEVGIRDITIVVGYMKEKMFYLGEKFDVEIVVNGDYHRYNNPSSLILVKEKISNTYICSSDNYFVENPFEEYVYQPYYASVYEEGKTEEYCLSYDSKGRITNVKIGGEDSWVMIGHVYFDSTFGQKFVEILEKEYEYSNTKEQLWENLYIRYIDELALYIKKYDNNIIKEFDSLEDLRKFDFDYIENSNSSIIKNICSVLKCDEKDILNINPIKAGLTNTSFSFTCFDKKYVYRYPGIGTEAFINRESEAISMNIAKKLGIDQTLIYIDAKEGWKLSYFVENAKTLDYHNSEQVAQAMKLLKKLHLNPEKSEFGFDVWKIIEDFKVLLTKANRIGFEGIDIIDSNINLLKEFLENDNIEKCLCHCDAYDPNFLIDEEGNMHLIDWEYSGMAVPAIDLGTFIACSDYSTEEAIKVVEVYLGHPATNEEIRHFMGYVAVLSYYWFLWALNQERNGKVLGEYTYIWYKYSKKYSKFALSLYQNEEKL